jgi:voltage-gated potassium channel
VNRGGHAFVNPPVNFRLRPGDDAVVVAESLGQLAPLEVREASAAELEPAVEVAAAST